MRYKKKFVYTSSWNSKPGNKKKKSLEKRWTEGGYAKGVNWKRGGFWNGKGAGKGRGFEKAFTKSRRNLLWAPEGKVGRKNGYENGYLERKDRIRLFGEKKTVSERLNSCTFGPRGINDRIKVGKQTESKGTGG